MAVSLIGHAALFSAFSFNFGARIVPFNFPAVSFYGSFLSSYDLTPLPQSKDYLKVGEAIVERREFSACFNKGEKAPYAFKPDYIKPAFAPSFYQERPVFLDSMVLTVNTPNRERTAIMFYPQFPYHFSLYFKDREAVHIELAFRVAHVGSKDIITVKRKVSSGNLEADLMCMRYISRYLSMQHSSLAGTGSWQSVKIDLSAKSDKQNIRR